MADVVTIISNELECTEIMPASPSVESESLLTESVAKTDDEIAKMDCHFDGKHFTVIMPDDSEKDEKELNSPQLMPPPKHLKIAPKLQNDKLAFASGGKISIASNARHSTMELPFVNNLKDTKLKATCVWMFLIEILLCYSSTKILCIQHVHTP